MIDLSIFTKEEIDLSIEKAINNFSMMPDMDMSRLDRQIDITRKILYSFSTTESKIAIIDAPTGFGKSILGFFLHRTMMYLINDFYKSKKEYNEFDDFEYRNYILTSNKFLQEQYLS